MKKAILLTLIILLGNILRYYRGGNNFRSSQSYWMREILSSSYKILVYLLPALLIFRTYRNQSRKIHRSPYRGRGAIGLIAVMMLGKQLAKRYPTENNITTLLLTMPYVLIINSVIEEWVFRGALFSSLQKTYPYLQANILQSICFGLVHLPLYISMGRSGFSLLGGIIGVMCLGFRRGYVKKETGSLFYPILLHSIRNGILIFL